jgi:glycosyltransferase involved in cell wall biosynthesis
LKEVLLLNRKKIPHYRVAVYSRLSEYLSRCGFRLTVAAEGIEQEGLQKPRFRLIRIGLRVENLSRLIIRMKPRVIIFWVNHEIQYYPVLLLAKLLDIKVIHWGHRRNLQRPSDLVNNVIYTFEHWLDDAIILYADHLKKYVGRKYLSKTFVANNTLDLTAAAPRRTPRGVVKDRYSIKTGKAIICMGRMQGRKRIDDLVRAFRQLEDPDVGLILAGPDPKGMLAHIVGERIYKVGPVYGEESLDLLSAADVCCIPGAIGLSIVDAFHCGLPIVTEDVLHGPEIMYLKEGINGFMVPAGDVDQLAARLKLLLGDDSLRKRFSRAAKTTIRINGHIDRMCEGFRDALLYVTRP